MKLAALLMLAGCATTGPTPRHDAGVTCAQACADGRERGCSWAADAEDGATCETVCADAERLLPGAFTGALEPCR